jgi:RNA polymerase sigma-70 factor (ECF subfamily)
MPASDTERSVDDMRRTLPERLTALLAAEDHEGAFALFRSTHEADVKRYVASLRPEATIDDICQEVWLAVHKALPAFRGDALPTTWLFAIARHKTADAVARRERRKPEVLCDNDVLQALAGAALQSSATSRIARGQRARAVRQALTRLGAQDREVIELRYVAGLLPHQIASALGLGANAVSQRLGRAVKKLRATLLSDDVLAPQRAAR